MKKAIFKRIALALVCLYLFALTACGTTPAEPESAAAPFPVSEAKPSAQSEAQPSGPDAESSKVLIAYFSATGTTKSVAEKLAAVTGGDLYEITPSQPYTQDDLNWHDSSSRTTLEQNDKSVRPEIGSEPISPDSYDTIYIGYPIWWGEEPRILDTFAAQYSFDGITMIPFCTSGGSGIGRSGQNLAEIAGSGNWLDGQRFSANVSSAEIQEWIDSLRK